jgi:hypothetical protein
MSDTNGFFLPVPVSTPGWIFFGFFTTETQRSQRSMGRGSVKENFFFLSGNPIKLRNLPKTMVVPGLMPDMQLFSVDGK